MNLKKGGQVTCENFDAQVGYFQEEEGRKGCGCLLCNDPKHDHVYNWESNASSVGEAQYI